MTDDYNPLRGPTDENVPDWDALSSWMDARYWKKITMPYAEILPVEYRMIDARFPYDMGKLISPDGDPLGMKPEIIRIFDRMGNWQPGRLIQDFPDNPLSYMGAHDIYYSNDRKFLQFGVRHDGPARWIKITVTGGTYRVMLIGWRGEGSYVIDKAVKVKPDELRFTVENMYLRMTGED